MKKRKPKKSKAPKITGDMVDRAFAIYGMRAPWTAPDDSKAAHRKLMRKALRAAFYGPLGVM